MGGYPLTIDITQVLIGIIGISSTFVGLVVWLVKWAEKRNATTQDAFVAFLKEQLKVHQVYSEGFDKLTEAVEAQTEIIKESAEAQCKMSTKMTNEMQRLGKATSTLCRHQGAKS